MRVRAYETGDKMSREITNWLHSLSPHQIEELTSLDAHLCDPEHKEVPISQDWIEEHGGERVYWFYLRWTED